jgi:type II secretory pathway component GspD/PulD (secretin)
MGGLMQNRKSRTHQGVPVLMHLPIVGALFRNRDDRDDRRELLVFLTPRILDPLQAAAMGEAYEQHYRERWSELSLPTTYTTKPSEQR